MDRQELVDRLVTAVTEQDTLYVLVWLDRIAHSKELSLAEAVETNHSWKGHSALVAAILEAYTPVRRLILEIFLFQLDKDPVETLGYRVARLRNDWAVSVMAEWEASGKKLARDAYNLLNVPLAFAEEWIKDNLPDHPAPDSLTGDGPLPPRPPAPTNGSARLAPIDALKGEGGAADHAPASVLPATSAASLSTLQIRLSELAEPVSFAELHARIRPFVEGLGEIRQVSRSAVVLTFIHSKPAKKALEVLKGELYPVVVTFEPTVPPPPPFSSAASFTFPSLEKPVQLHVGHLLTGTTLNCAAQLFRRSTGVAFSNAFQKHQGRSFYATVRSPIEYGRVSAALHGVSYAHNHLLVERTPPAPSRGHPIVTVHNLPPSTSLATLEAYVRATRTGSYNPELRVVGRGTAHGAVVGEFRAPSPASAQEAVVRLGKVEESGMRLRAEWRKGEMVEWRTGGGGPVKHMREGEKSKAKEMVVEPEPVGQREVKPRLAAADLAPARPVPRRPRPPKTPSVWAGSDTDDSLDDASLDAPEEEEFDIKPVVAQNADVLDLTADSPPPPAASPAKKAKKAAAKAKKAAAKAERLLPSPAPSSGSGLAGFRARYTKAWAEGEAMGLGSGKEDGTRKRRKIG